MALRTRALTAAALALAALAAPAPVTAAAQQGGAQAAAAGPQLPGTFDVRGAPLAKRRRTVAGREISVWLRPRAAALDGCRSRSSRVRPRRGRVAIAIAARCEGIPGTLRVRGVVRGKVLRGTATRARRTRRFRARLNPPPGRLLRGRRSARATRSVRDTGRLQRHPDSEVSRARGGTLVPRTEIALRLRPGATVGQVNAALRSVGGRIAGSLDGSTHLIVSIPDPGSLAALDKVLAGLERRKAVRRADRTELAAPQELPPAAGSPPSAARAAELSHLLAMRMPAAWNARAAVNPANRPVVIVADIFGNGALSSQVDATVAASDLLSGLLPIISQTSRGHGYHVTGIIAANFAGSATAAGRVTGVFPSTTRLEIVDVTGETLDAAAVRVLQAVQAQQGRVVVNTSLGHNPGTTDSYARQEGSDWSHEVRTRGYVNRMLHAGAAGNDGAEASRNSPWVSATLRTDLRDPIDGAALGRLTNTLAVENLVDSGAPEFTPGCLSFTSNHGGTIAAVGHQVFSNLFGAAAGNRNGTSMASPQVAGLAEYLWSIAPDLTAPQLRTMMVATAAPPLPDSANCGTDAPSAPRLDAYRAVLSLDQGVPVTGASAPVRMAILDRTGDGAFTQADLVAHAGARRLTGEGPRDWSRSDLNGDGFTGGLRTAPFDLDPNGSPRGGAPQLGVATTADGSDLSFDENAVTDVQILCFYARSALYTGSPEQRDQLLGSALGCGAPPEPAESENCTATTAFGQAATIMGTSGDDQIRGTSGDDVIVGGDGNDTISGQEGNDRVCSGAGDDVVRGGSGRNENDDEDGFGPNPPIDSGDDLLDGGPGTDRVTGTGGDDRVFGGAGDSDTVIGGSPGSDFMDGGPGAEDTCFRGEIPRDSAQPGADSFGPGCEHVFNF